MKLFLKNEINYLSFVFLKCTGSCNNATLTRRVWCNSSVCNQDERPSSTRRCVLSHCTNRSIHQNLNTTSTRPAIISSYKSTKTPLNTTVLPTSSTKTVTTSHRKTLTTTTRLEKTSTTTKISTTVEKKISITKPSTTSAPTKKITTTTKASTKKIVPTQKITTTTTTKKNIIATTRKSPRRTG